MTIVRVKVEFFIVDFGDLPGVDVTIPSYLPYCSGKTEGKMNRGGPLPPVGRH